MNRKTVFIILVLVLLGSLVFYFSKLRGVSQPGLSNLPAKPSIPNFVKGPINIKSAISKENFNFPEKLPLVLVEKAPSLTEGEVLQVASRAGFLSKDYIVANDINRGKTYIFRKDETSLTVYSKENSLVFVSAIENPPTKISVPDETLIATAGNFLKDTFLSETETVHFSSINYLLDEREQLTVTDQASANLFKVNFSPVDSDIKFVEINPLNSSISVWLTPLGQIIKAEIKKVSDARFSTEEVLLKTYEEFNTSLSGSTLVSLDDGNIFPGDLPEGAIGEITVDNIEVVYYQEDGSKGFYQPVFLLKGAAEVKSYGSLSVVLYLPATKGF